MKVSKTCAPIKEQDNCGVFTCFSGGGRVPGHHRWGPGVAGGDEAESSVES